MVCCTGHTENRFFEIICLAPKLCEMYATILLKLFLNCHLNCQTKIIKHLRLSYLLEYK